MQVSQVYWVYLLVSLLSKAECHVTVTVAESADTESGGTKVKVGSCDMYSSMHLAAELRQGFDKLQGCTCISTPCMS